MTVIVCPNEGEMSDCKKKPKCKWGECEGQALPSDPKDYCNFGYNFREEYCDCEAEYGKLFIAVVKREFLTSASCGANCVKNGVVDFDTVIIQTPLSTENFLPIGEFHLQSISQFCPNGPVNCGRTPASYGVTWTNGGGPNGYPGVFFPNKSFYSLDFNYVGNPGVGVFYCGSSDTLFVLFEMESDPSQIIAIRLRAGISGGVGCTTSHVHLVSIEPYEYP